MSLAPTLRSDIALRKAVKIDGTNKGRFRQTIGCGCPERKAHICTNIANAATENAALMPPKTCNDALGAFWIDENCI